MQKVSDNSFKNFIKKSDLSLENRLFVDLLFSKDELDTPMRIGFVGSPNIGCVALNEFKNSNEFNAFRSAAKKTDKLFFIGSIFGGTGASGLPLLISSIRDLGHKDNNDDDGKTECSKAPIGALIVMPYFSIEQKKDSKINSVEFELKTRSALRYYHTNLNKYINNIYYVADRLGTNDFTNDPGNVNNQKGNKAHVVEFIGGLSIFDFISDNNNETIVDGNQRIVAKTTKTLAYGLKNDSHYIKFPDFPNETNRLCIKPLIKFHILRLFMEKYLSINDDRPFAKNYEPKINKSVYTTEIKKFFSEYDTWLNEMKDQGSDAHNLDLFENLLGDDFSKIAKSIDVKKTGLFRTKESLNVEKLIKFKNGLNDVADNPDYKKMPTADKRWFAIANKAIENRLNETFELLSLTD